ncbi:phosphatase PAP2 family protein [Aggregatimonas sangjinii]|uniref:Phosphatase PAP2 family protein n=1 Tax=Aggregatimonas sangjinii TaxID=2583587 RepID=A0A5B7SUD6_9FLAO|nr:phosphatase PAP2 family protein [Aggregatimonas sangjinii]QCX00753.1 phosphatase PAP2 family protein [Aggregatimonas sangjinii]
MWETLIQYDKELFLFLNNLGSPTWDAFWMFLTHKLSSIPLYILLLYLSFKKFGLKSTLVLLVAVALMIVVTNGLADFFKYGVQRLRPCFDPDLNDAFRLVKAHCGGTYGYFSAHASNTSAVAIFFIILLKSNFRYIGIFLLLWAFLVGYSRIYIGVHFPSDVLSGMAIGVLFGWLFAKLYIFALLRLPK